MLKFLISLAAVIVRFYGFSCQRFFAGGEKLSMLSEFQFLENLRNRYSLAKIGDDCAVLPKDSRTDLVVTTDLLVEDIDFRLEWTRAEFIGHKALAVSLSDVAAMGAKPVWSMISIGVPERLWKTDFVDEFYKGYMRLAERYGVELVGGDISQTPDKIVVDSIVAGEVEKGKAVRRSGAQAGDFIYVTGELGGANLGLRLLEAGEKFETSAHKNLLLRQLVPIPQTEIGRILGESNLATAMIDLSDGLSSDLAHLCAASRVGAQIFADRIPVESEILDFNSASFEPADKISFALEGGEDFELLFTVCPEKIFSLEKELSNHPISRLGKVTANVETIELTRDKKIEILEPKGFRHF
jgi:thiamine-monophosphate kinase